MITLLISLAIASGVLSLGSFMAGTQASHSGAILFVNVHHLELMGLGFGLGMVGCLVGACLVAKLEQICTVLAERLPSTETEKASWH